MDRRPVGTVVSVASSGTVDPTEITPSFRLQDSGPNVTLVGTTGPDTYEKGTTQIGLVVGTGDAKDPENGGVVPSGGRLFDRGTIGSVRLSFTFERSSIFYRPDQDSSRYTDNAERVTLESRTYNYRDFGTSEVDDLVDRSFNELESGIVTSFSLYSTILTTGSSITLSRGQKAVLKLVKQSQKGLANQIEAGEFDGGVRLEREGGEVYEFTKAEVLNTARIVYLKLEEIGIYREN